jgi:TolA-binding protein/peroxiredoxin
MTSNRILCCALLAGVLVLPARTLVAEGDAPSAARALDAEGDAWTAALTLEQQAAANLAQITKFAEARAAFDAFAKAYPASAHHSDALAESAWCAAMDLKVKSRYVESAAAFDAYAKSFPASPHANESLVESGVAFFALGKSKQALQRNTPESVRDFNAAIERFDKIAREHAGDDAAGRANYMRGATHLILGDLESAEKDFTTVIDKYSGDKKYFGKALERRAGTRRHLLKTSLSLADLQRYQKEVGRGGADAELNRDAELVARYLSYTMMFEKPAPPLDIESWVQGDPTTLEQLRGEVVVLYFFATWCPNCAKEKDHALDVVARYEPMGVKFVGVITHSQGTTAELARPFLAANKYNFPVLMDRGSTVGTYLSAKIPDMVIIDRAGRIRWHDHPSNLQDSTLDTLIGEDVAAATAPSAATKSH